MSYKSIYTWLCVLFCLCACRDDSFFNPDPAVRALTGKTIPVAIKVELEPPSLWIPTRAAGSSPVLQASFPGMDVELSGPPAADTRALPNWSDTDILHLIILQFDGLAETSKCVKADYFLSTDGGIPDLSTYTFKEMADKNAVSRIAVVTNIPSNYIDVPEWNKGGKTYKNLLDQVLYYDDDAPSGHANYPLLGKTQPRSVMFGIADTKLEQGKPISVRLQRNYARVVFNIDIVDRLKLQYPLWRATLKNLPGRSFFFPVGRGAVFPTVEQLAGDGYNDREPVDAVNGSFDLNAVSWNIPVNFQRDVPTASRLTRRILAPQWGTYLEIMGYKLGTSSKNIIDQIIYRIYLGNNLTTNYSVSPNSSYYYTIYLKDDSSEDGTVIKFVPGYWSGKLKAYGQDGLELPLSAPVKQIEKWQYEKKIEVSSVDLLSNAGSPNMGWGAIGNAFGATDFMDGKLNTSNVLANTIANPFPAFAACNALNEGQAVFKTPTSGWYLPGISQLLATYLVSDYLYSTLSYSYWSSTAEDASGNNAYYITRNGHVLRQLKTESANFFVRAVRDFAE